MNIGIYGYGNLGRGVEAAICNSSDANLVGIFTRRSPDSIRTVSGAKVYHIDDILDFKNEIDVLIICGGSATDLPKMTPDLARDFNVIDSFDTHAKIPEHYEKVDIAARNSGHTALISAGWDPGLFSIMRTYFEAVLPNGKNYTFWGKGVSQGHSDAIRRIEGVVDARQYTIPVSEALEAVRGGECPEFTTRQKHRRECYVVVEDGADKAKIEREIKEMPNYFADYDTTVNFVDTEELRANHSGLPHGGYVIHNGKSGFENENTHTIEFGLRLDSNPEFTASVLVAYARAVLKMFNRGDFGCKTVLDVCPADLSARSNEELRANIL